MNNDKLRNLLFWLIFPLSIMDMIILLAYREQLINLYQKLWQFLWPFFSLILVIFALWKNRNKGYKGNKSLANIIEGAIGGFVMFFILSFRSSTDDYSSIFRNSLKIRH